MDEEKDLPKLIFVVPGPDEPGYLERMIAVGGFTEMIESQKITRQGFEDMVRFLADYVKEPKDINQRIKLIIGATENEIKSLLDALANSGKVNPTNGGNSDEPSKTEN